MFRVVALPAPDDREKARCICNATSPTFPPPVKSFSLWDEYTRARDEMFMDTDMPFAPWHVANFISTPVLTGFKAGVGLVILRPEGRIFFKW